MSECLRACMHACVRACVRACVGGGGVFIYFMTISVKSKIAKL